MRARISAVAVVVCLLCSVSPPTTRAQDAPATLSPAERALDRGRSLYVAGDRVGARESFQRAAELALGTDDSVRATALNNACVLSNELGEPRRALDDCLASLELRRRLGPERALARALNNVGLASHYLGRQRVAREAFLEALAINRRGGDALSESINLSNLGLVATSRGRLGEALEHHRQAEALASRHADEPWAAEQLGVALINQGVALERLGAHRQALELLRRVEPRSEAMPPRHRAGLLVNLGVLYRNLGAPDRAAEALREAAAIFEREGDLAALSNATVNLGLLLHRTLGRLDDAEDAFRRALELAREGDDAAEEARALDLLGRLLLERDRRDEAERTFRAALGQEGAADPHAGETDPSETVEAEIVAAETAASAHHGLARIALADGRPHDAWDATSRAVDAVEAIRAGVDDASLRGSFFAPRRAVYETAVVTAWRLHRLEPDAGWSRRALAMALRAKERDLAEALGVSFDAPLDRLTDGEDPTLDALRETAAGRPLLEIFLADDRAYAWLLDGAADLRWSDLGPARALEHDAFAVHRALARAEAPPPAALDRLGDVLLDPLLGPLREADSRNRPDHLLVAADGRLRYVPFELLPTDEGGTLLIDSTTVTYLPSAATLRRGARGGRGAASGAVPADGVEPSFEPTLRFAGIGAPSAGAEPGTAAAALTARYGLPPLPATSEELESAAATLGGAHRLALGERATEAAFRQLATAGSRVLHLAGHTVFGEGTSRREPEAAILLAPSGDDDGLLRPAEISSLAIDADLVVLAACRSALGPLDPEVDPEVDRASLDRDALDLDGGTPSGATAVDSLTGAFLAAGAGAVVASLWDVGDGSSRVIMEQLYHELERGRPPAEALAVVKRRLRDDPRWSRPELWAAYVVIGDGPALETGLGARTLRAVRSSPWTAASALAFALVVAAALGALAARRFGRRSSTDDPVREPTRTSR